MPTSEPTKVGHDTLFEVFHHESGRLFGMGNQGDDVIVVDGPQGGASVSRMTLAKAVGILGVRVRNGYSRAAGRMFFNERSGTFTFVHPDVDWKGLKWLLAAIPPSIEDAAHSVAALVHTMPAEAITAEEIDQWIARQGNNVRHLVAFNDHPAWPLALAQAALLNGWSLRAAHDLGAAPDAPPSIAPIAWAQWLSSSFTLGLVKDAQATLGWTTEAFITSGSPAPSGASDLSALI